MDNTNVLFVTVIIACTIIVVCALFVPDEKPPELKFDNIMDTGIMRDGDYLVWVEEGKQVLRIQCEEALYGDDGMIMLWFTEDQPGENSWMFQECEDAGKVVLVDRNRNKILCVIDGRFAEEGEWDMSLEDLCESLKPTPNIDDAFWQVPNYINGDPVFGTEGEWAITVKGYVDDSWRIGDDYENTLRLGDE